MHPERLEGGSSHRCGFVALAGCPNVGKSTLLNRFLGENLAIATPMPQTTRRTMRGILTLPGSQIVFLDTPGIHRPHNSLNEAMVAAAKEAVHDADVVVMLVDASRPMGKGDRAVAEVCLAGGRPVVLGLNKWDAVAETDRAPRREEYAALGAFAAVAEFSALDSAASAILLPLLLERLPEGPAFYPDEQVSDQTLRDLICELVREQVILHCSQEVPHAVAVLVDRYQEEGGQDDAEGDGEQRGDDLKEPGQKGGDHVWATIYVERDSQKGILIGKGGSMIRDIGSKARARMAEVIGRPVHLRLFVKVHPEWRKDSKFLRELGYQ
ncbi:MAG: GTPase Era [Nitrospirota bacterium]|nr:GTPase Era [Nitrospirota bacterium]